MKKHMLAVVLAAMTGAALSASAGVKYQDGEKYLKLGGRIQLQYHYTDVDEGDSEDELRFRRLRPYIQGSVHEDWTGKFQFDLGKSKLGIKDAYMEYSGFEGLDIAVGNVSTPFSREFLTSSKRQQLVERTFVGDHNYGTPDRQAGIHLSGALAEKMVTWGLSGALGAVDPDNDKLDFDTTIQYDKGSDWSEGPMAVGRVDFHPLGYLKKAQGDFDGEPKVTVGVAAFTWSNDDDNLAGGELDDMGALIVGKQDVDSVTGLEVSAAFRAAGLSVDAQYNTFDSELVQAGVTDGLYENSETTLENYALEGGFMIVPNRLELVAGYQGQDADNYEDTWTRTSVGANVFVHKHDIKYQVTYRMGENVDGVADADADEVFVQAQYVF